ncbi:hypothetical protein TWF569_006798 [Orbilia oligospora]|uniref:Uncharacterized protein n=2 Tax=Orbilia oligospora TaxID=2813651 RepID=A0A7C8J2C3_ORBOL|nr:hypothetical protein TWF102_009646 [Orbilia oligospora]KAF3109681.1 hypothetical protein TWF103_005048 [Orbilia oligospora]KAF3144578.1 hypothetical protein TWF594_004733 [Orbilia oligospora]KAF3156214.1 hypothetical protein TWF569_006798 [Orbilia oligospora]
MMSLKMVLLGIIFVTLDGVFGLNAQHRRAVEPLQDGAVIGYSIADGLLKRQVGVCPIGSRECARVSGQILCAGVCCFEDGVFSFGCDPGYNCAGSGADAGCCRVGRICTGSPPPCVDNGEPAPSPTLACPADQPICTTNARGAPICSGDATVGNTRSFTITLTSTVSTTVTSSTSELEAETTEEPEPTTTTTEVPEPEPTTTEETSTVEETTTLTITTSEIPEETTTAYEPSLTSVETTEISTVTPSPTRSSNATVTPPPPATSNSGRISTVNLIIALISVAFAFFMF